MLSITIAGEGLRIFYSSLKRKIFGLKKFKGDDEQICNGIINACWNKRFYQTSAGHFSQFYSRDFGWSIESLLQIGRREEVLKTLDYAIERYNRAGRIGVAITPDGSVFDFPNYDSIDSMAYLFRSLRIAKAERIVKRYKAFLENELERAFSFLTKDGLVDPNKNFSGMRDYAIRKSSCYDNTCMAMLSKEADLLGLNNPLKKFNFKKVLIKHFWNGKYFNDDLHSDEFTADANIYPFYFNLFAAKNTKNKKEQKMLWSVIGEMKKEGLDMPFPMKYTNSRKGKMIFIEFLVNNWERHHIWALMAFPYIEILARVDHARAIEHLISYKRLIEKHGTLLEVYTHHGRPYTSFFYHADEGLIWCANYLTLKKKLIR